MPSLFNNPNGTVFQGSNYNPFSGSGALTHAYYTDNPDASFGAFLGQQGAAGPFGNYLQRNYQRLLAQYRGDEVNNPGQSFYDYLGRNRQGLQHEFNDLSPYARGERPDSVVGRIRYVGF